LYFPIVKPNTFSPTMTRKMDHVRPMVVDAV